MLFFKNNRISNFSKILIVTIIPFLSYYGLCSLNKRNSGYFTTTTYAGLYLSQIATSFIEKSSAEDKIITDIIVKYRDSVKAVEPENTAMSVWFAHEELKKKTQLNEQDLNNKLGDISKALFIKYPHLYLSRAVKSFVTFWGYEKYLTINYNSFKNKYFRYFVSITLKFQKYLILILNILFLFFSLKKIISFFKNKLNSFDFDLFVTYTVLVAAFSQALLVYGPNSRFAFPFLSLIIYVTISNLIPLKSKK